MLRNGWEPYYYINPIGWRMNSDILAMNFTQTEYGGKGFVIDTGTTLTWLTSSYFNMLLDSIKSVYGTPTSTEHFEICYPIGKFSVWGWKRPNITLVFSSSTNDEFVFDEDRLWSKHVEDEFDCLMIRRELYSDLSILGVFQLLSTNVGYDPWAESLYLDKNKC